MIPPDVTPQRQSFTYANEADVLNVALFGITSKEWRQTHQDSKGNIRDEASLQQLIVLANLESINAELIRQGVPQSERLLRLNASAKQIIVLTNLGRMVNCRIRKANKPQAYIKTKFIIRNIHRNLYSATHWEASLWNLTVKYLILCHLEAKPLT